jgi:two-component system, cell cycle response regulator DivK
MKYQILIVEDNPPSRELLSDWLELEGFEVIRAANIEQAYAAFADAPPDAVLLDVQLGIEDGLSIARWIREHLQFRNIPVIAVTAHAMVTDQERVMQAGCNACVSKPVDFQLLRRHLALYFPDPPGEV